MTGNGKSERRRYYELVKNFVNLDCVGWRIEAVAKEEFEVLSKVIRTEPCPIRKVATGIKNKMCRSLAKCMCTIIHRVSQIKWVFFFLGGGGVVFLLL